MKTLTLCAVVLFSAVLFVDAARAQSTAAAPVAGLRPDVAMDQAPASILGAMRSSYHPTLGRYLGLQSGADVDQTAVGAPIRMVLVRLDLLRTYDGISPADALLQELPQVTRVVRVGGVVQSTLLMSSARGAWEVTRIGDTVRAVAIDRVTTLLQQNGAVPADTLFLVTIRGLGLDFLGYSTADGVVLAPLFDVPRHGLVAGRPAPAATVLGSLVAAAQAVPTMRTRDKQP